MDFNDIGLEGVEWIRLAQDRDQLWTFVNAVMNFRVTKKAGNFLSSWGALTVSQEGLHYMQ
jgi:hypothetical protein